MGKRRGRWYNVPRARRTRDTVSATHSRVKATENAKKVTLDDRLESPDKLYRSKSCHRGWATERSDKLRRSGRSAERDLPGRLSIIVLRGCRYITRDNDLRGDDLRSREVDRKLRDDPRVNRVSTRSVVARGNGETRFPRFEALSFSFEMIISRM